MQGKSNYLATAMLGVDFTGHENELNTTCVLTDI